MSAVPLSTPVHPGDRMPADLAVLNAPFAQSGKLTLALGDQCQGRAQEQMNAWSTGCNTLHRGRYPHPQVTVEKAGM